MKVFIVLFLILNSLYALRLSDKLPNNAPKFINSFECFSEDDKLMLYTYMLALDYRMNNVDNMENLKKSDLDYWRMWHIVSDIRQKCKLYYKFDDQLENILVPTEVRKKILKKLRRVEGRINTDGSSELSKRMREYDAKLKAMVLAKKPKFSIEKPLKNSPDYDLASLKKLPENTIPKNVYNSIRKMKISKKNKNILYRYAYLREEFIRSYDQPEKRHKLKQEMIYLEECKKRKKLYDSTDFTISPKRKMAYRVGNSSSFYPLKKDFLPKEIDSYCENNITAMKLSPIDIKFKKPVAKKINIPKFTNTKKVIKEYKGNNATKNKMKNYLNNISKAIGEKRKVNGLEFVRLQNCLKDEELFKKALYQDIKEEDIKESFSEFILRPQMFWITTIAMKIQQEGENKELKHFFDCNQTSLFKKSNRKTNYYKSDMRKAIKQKDSILKYYVKVYENKPTPNISNKKAIKAGIIESEWITKHNNIKTPFGNSINIEGMPKGGIKLTYTGIPKGEECSDFISLNLSDTIYFDSKSYEGLDYILVNNDKVKVNHSTNKFMEKVCNKQENNKVSFVKENISRKYKYKQKEIDSSYGIAKKITVIDRMRYGPNSFAHSQKNSKLYVFGNKGNVYDKILKTKLPTLPKDLNNNSYYNAVSPDGSLLATTKYNKIYIVNTATNKIIKIIENLPKDASNVLSILSDNKTVVTTGKSVYFINLETEKIIEITPNFVDKDKKYFTPRITAIGESVDGSVIYIGSSRGDVERWQVDRKFFSSEISKVTFIDILEDKQSRNIGVFMHDPRDENHLIVASSDKICFWDIKNKKIIKTLKSDIYMNPKYLQMSSNNKYLMASSEYGIFIWKLDQNEQYEFLNGDAHKGAVFVSDKEFISISKNISLWSLEP